MEVERREHYLTALAWWIAPCIALYVGGRTIRWVRDGFARGQ